MVSFGLAGPPLAHFGHWYVGMLYLAPVAILVSVLMIQGRRDRRAEAEEIEAARLAGEPLPGDGDTDDD
jgi:hypothetical protein